MKSSMMLWVLGLAISFGIMTPASFGQGLGATQIGPGLQNFADCQTRVVGHHEHLIADRLQARLDKATSLTPEEHDIWAAEIRARAAADIFRRPRLTVPFGRPGPRLAAFLLPAGRPRRGNGMLCLIGRAASGAQQNRPQESRSLLPSRYFSTDHFTHAGGWTVEAGGALEPDC